MPSSHGSMMAPSAPAAMSMARKARFSRLRFGMPKEMLLRPSAMWASGSSAFVARTASRMQRAWPGFVEAGRTRWSKCRRSRPMPSACTASASLRVTAMRPSRSSGIPPSSIVSATTCVPYFLTSGRTPSSRSFSPVIELMTEPGRLHRLRPLSRASGFVESKLMGSSVAAATASVSQAMSSTSRSGSCPAFTSICVAPASSWRLTWRAMYAASLASTFSWMRLRVMLMRSAMMVNMAGQPASFFFSPSSFLRRRRT